MSGVKIGMPQMTARGLSENWLFKYCGDAHWKAIAGIYGVQTGNLVTESGERVYASFVAIRVRCGIPIGAIREDDEIDFTIDVDRFGDSILRTRHRGTIAGRPLLSMEMITKFVRRASEGSNNLLRASVRPQMKVRVPELDTPPELLRDFQLVRAGETFSVPEFPAAISSVPVDLLLHYMPNPYADFNGAGLLYFAAYPTITDHLERIAVSMRLQDQVKCDWAIGASTVARDVFYFGNLDLGCDISGHVRSFGCSNDQVTSHTVLMEAGSNRKLAEIYTSKALHG